MNERNWLRVRNAIILAAAVAVWAGVSTWDHNDSELNHSTKEETK